MLVCFLQGGSPAPRTVPGWRWAVLAGGGYVVLTLRGLGGMLSSHRLLRGALMGVTCLLLARLSAWAPPPAVTTPGVCHPHKP